MAKASGWTRTTNARRQAPTERGYSRALERAVTSFESGIRTRTKEYGAFFDRSGQIVQEVTSNSVNHINVSRGLQTQDLIFTHNHPYRAGSPLEIGGTLSRGDMLSAIRHNEAEARAVTTYYTFSIKRPASGWGATEEEVRSAYRSIQNRMTRYVRSYYRQIRTEDAKRRAQTVYWHMVNKEVAKRFGWIYTRKRNEL